MYLPLEAPILMREHVNQFFKLLQVFLKLYWSSAADLLIYLRQRLEVFGPLQWQPECHPLQYRARKEVISCADGSLAHCAFEGIVQMADHLVWRHTAPLPLALRSY